MVTAQKLQRNSLTQRKPLGFSIPILLWFGAFSASVFSPPKGRSFTVACSFGRGIGQLMSKAALVEPQYHILLRHKSPKPVRRPQKGEQNPVIAKDRLFPFACRLSYVQKCDRQLLISPPFALSTTSPRCAEQPLIRSEKTLPYCTNCRLP